MARIQGMQQICPYLLQRSKPATLHIGLASMSTSLDDYAIYARCCTNSIADIEQQYVQCLQQEPQQMP